MLSSYSAFFSMVVANVLSFMSTSTYAMILNLEIFMFGLHTSLMKPWSWSIAWWPSPWPFCSNMNVASWSRCHKIFVNLLNFWKCCNIRVQNNLLATSHNTPYPNYILSLQVCVSHQPKPLFSIWATFEHKVANILQLRHDNLYCVSKQVL